MYCPICHKNFEDCKHSLRDTDEFNDYIKIREKLLKDSNFIQRLAQEVRARVKELR